MGCTSTSKQAVLSEYPEQVFAENTFEKNCKWAPPLNTPEPEGLVCFQPGVQAGRRARNDSESPGIVKAMLLFAVIMRQDWSKASFTGPGQDGNTDLFRFCCVYRPLLQRSEGLAIVASVG